MMVAMPPSNAQLMMPQSQSPAMNQSASAAMRLPSRKRRMRGRVLGVGAVDCMRGS